jgi:hypothetical protein
MAGVVEKVRPQVSENKAQAVLDAERDRRNAEYLAKLDRAFKNVEAGRVISFEGEDWMSWTPEQLKAYADEQRAHWPK